MINDENQEKNPGHEAFMPKDNNESNVSLDKNYCYQFQVGVGVDNVSL